MWQQGIPLLFLGYRQAGLHHFHAENLPLKLPISQYGFFVSVSSWTGSQINCYSRRIPLQRAAAQIISTVCQLLSPRIIFLAVAAASNSCIPMRVLHIALNVMQWYHWPCGFGRDWKAIGPQLFLSLPYHKQNLLLLGNCCRDICWTFCFAYLLLFKALHIPCPSSNSLITILSIAHTFIVPPVAFMWSGCLIPCQQLQILLECIFLLLQGRKINLCRWKPRSSAVQESGLYTISTRGITQAWRRLMNMMSRTAVKMRNAHCSFLYASVSHICYYFTLLIRSDIVQNGYRDLAKTKSKFLLFQEIKILLSTLQGGDSSKYHSFWERTSKEKCCFELKFILNHFKAEFEIKRSP